ncbi:MAG: BLUF domain-containing protein [Chloroflexota bacterium]|nr:BLUF domain-containing protein [Chloroflexota bacterium]
MIAAAQSSAAIRLIATFVQIVQRERHAPHSGLSLGGGAFLCLFRFRSARLFGHASYHTINMLRCSATTVQISAKEASMRSILYASSAPFLLQEAELLDILRVSQANNARVGITGMLLYKGGNFMQVIEGPDAAVAALYQRIGRDPRHHAIETLLDDSSTERDFPSWSMGFQNVDHLLADALPGFSAFLTEPFTAARFRADPRATYFFLLAFRETMR